VTGLAARTLVALVLLALGAGTGIAVIALHDLAWGLALGAAASVLAALALPPGWWGRLAFSLGTACMIGWLTMPRPEGDYVVSKDWQGYAVLGLALILLVLGVATLPRPRRPAEPQ